MFISVSISNSISKLIDQLPFLFHAFFSVNCFHLSILFFHRVYYSLYGIDNSLPPLFLWLVLALKL